MIDKNKFHVLNYIKKEEYTGSMEGMRYMLKKKKVGDGDKLETVIWPEPFGYAKTPEEKKQRKDFDFSKEGLEEAVDWLNGQHELQRELWRTGDISQEAEGGDIRCR
ncbi:hypothetical protein [Dysosmobacter sp.]|uniref:hypothetical protein n=1 Tax=Dysosmobacter sp. TaxID=2591382 RepID=UPI002A8936D4|nr:hypothetical protein [Dysosmobacter sp.]MDY3985320.1 hypothetical protein [Dysosmobacter sp.]